MFFIIITLDQKSQIKTKLLLCPTKILSPSGTADGYIHFIFCIEGQMTDISG